MSSQYAAEAAMTWTERVSKLAEESTREQPAFDDEEKDRMLTALWGPKRMTPVAAAGERAASPTFSSAPADVKLSADIRTFLVHLAISNTITPELRVKDPAPASSASRRPTTAAGAAAPAAGSAEYVLNFSSPDELALCKFAAHMGFQFTSRSKDGIALTIDKQGYGDGQSEAMLFESLAILDFNSKRKRVTCIYLRDNQVHVMCKGADANVMPLISVGQPAQLELRTTLDAQLNDMATKGLRTLVVAGCVLPVEWWFGANGSGGMRAVYDAVNLPDRGAEKGHHRGECHASCRICEGLAHMERSAQMELLGATAIEDRLSPLVPECIADMLAAGIKNLIDPDMESAADLLGSLDPSDINRVIEITGDWVSMTSKEDQLRTLFDLLDCAGDMIDGARTGYISREELRLFLIGLRVPGMDDDRKFDAHWTLVESGHSGRISFSEFARFMRNLQPSHMRAVQTDIELGLRKARLIAGDGTPEERRERLERNPISLVVEGDAFSVMFPSRPHARRRESAQQQPQSSMWNSPRMTRARGALASQLRHQDDDDYGSPEVLFLREAFFELASMAKSVICCRLTPSQKGRIVEEFHKKGHVTLAIGDGGNDELMIRKANIGVGITGLEGTAASRAADYSFAQFRFLHTLIFVHGYWNYRRNAELVLFMFYKAGMIACAMYIYGFASAMSGQQFFNDPIYILYSVAFTALPILFLAIFDRGGLNRATLENNPRAYLSIAGGYFFHDGIFFMWLLRAVWNTLWICGVVYATVGLNNISGDSGETHGLWFMSTLVYTAVVLLVSVRIFFEAQSINVFIAFFTLLSIACYFAIVEFAASLLRLNPNLYGVFARILASPICWFALILAVMVPLLVDVTMWAWQRSHRPTYVDVLQERQQLSKARLQLLDASSQGHASSSAARVRTRAVPHLSQQEKDDALLHKIRRALNQAHQESARASDAASVSAVAAGSTAADGADDASNSQRRAEALVYTMTRFQNLSGANLDATPQRNILSLYENTREKMTPAQQAARKEREATLAADATREHQLAQKKQAAAAKEAAEARQRAEAARLEAEQQEQRSARHRRRPSEAGASSAHEPVLQQRDSDDLSDELSDDDNAIPEPSLVAGRGRVHAPGGEDDAIELTIAESSQQQEHKEM